jgi:branched-chain amino acid transport system permease protein
VAFAPTLVMVTGLMLAIETIVHFTVNPNEDSHIRAFGIPFDAENRAIWAVSAVLIVGGFWLARKSWARVGLAWDDALTEARGKGIAA